MGRTSPAGNHAFSSKAELAGTDYPNLSANIEKSNLLAIPFRQWGVGSGAAEVTDWNTQSTAV